MKQWYFEANGSQHGPVGTDALRRLINEGQVRKDTYVWTAEFQDWKQAGTVGELFNGPPPFQHRAPQAGYSSEPAPRKQYVESHMAKAILTTLFCCLPFGIVAIVNASKVDGLVASGNYEEAERKSEEANKWANISIGLGIGIAVLYFLVVVAAGFGGGY